MPLLELRAEGVQIAQHRGARFSGLELGEALLEVVEETGGVRAWGVGGLGNGGRGGRSPPRHQEERPTPAQEHGTREPRPRTGVDVLSKQHGDAQKAKTRDSRDHPEFAHAPDIIRPQKARSIGDRGARTAMLSSQIRSPGDGWRAQKRFLSVRPAAPHRPSGRASAPDAASGTPSPPRFRGPGGRPGAERGPPGRPPRARSRRRRGSSSRVSTPDRRSSIACSAAVSWRDR